METHHIVTALLGGTLIGLAASVMLLFNGRVTGISGILSTALTQTKNDGLWRWLFLAGMISGGFLMRTINPELFADTSDRGPLIVALAGLLVGYGTVMGSGCTSGHGVCGIGRLSVRSIIATLTFLLSGFITVQVVRFLTGGAS